MLDVTEPSLFVKCEIFDRVVSDGLQSLSDTVSYTCDMFFLQSIVLSCCRHATASIYTSQTVGTHVCAVQFACISVCTSAEGQQEWCVQELLEIKPFCVHRWRSGCPQQFLQHLGNHGYFQTPPLHLQPQHRLHLLVSTSLQTVSTHMHFSVTLYSRERRLQSSSVGFNPGFVNYQVENTFAERSGTSGECAVHL